jgi:hypothetical protein
MSSLAPKNISVVKILLIENIKNPILTNNTKYTNIMNAHISTVSYDVDTSAINKYVGDANYKNTFIQNVNSHIDL